MSSNVPIISVTADSHRRNVYEHHCTSTSSDSDDSSDNDMDYNQNFGGHTDVEDFDSCADGDRPRSRRSSKNILFIPKGLACSQGDITDVEDYNDSGADEDDDKSTAYPELKLSLQEFLKNDTQGHVSSTNGMNEIVEHKSGNFSQAQNLNALNDYLTDCEDYNTDSEMENNYEKSACIDLKETMVDQGSLNIADSTIKTQNDDDSDCDNDDVSDISDAPSALAGLTDNELQCMSEAEIFELSSGAEICQISCSDSDSISNAGDISEEDLLSIASVPPIDVTFIPVTNITKFYGEPFINDSVAKAALGQNKFLDVKEKRREEVLTDTERFDDSVAEGDDDDSFDGDEDNQPIPQAVIMAVGDDGGCTTDCEDLLCDDVSDIAIAGQDSAHSVDVNAIPLPQREVVILQEDKFGDTITSVMPMDKEYQFGIYSTPRDECLTDTEEYSCADDFDVQASLADPPSRAISPSPQNAIVDPDITVANELLKPQQSKRLEIISNCESVTDVEEIYMAGTNSRKKKFKNRAVNKTKSKFLETPKPNNRGDGGGTDIEDMDISESELLPSSLCIKKDETKRQSNNSHSEKVTDVEDITADDMSFVSDVELPAIEKNSSNLKDYEAISKNIVVALETCGLTTCPKEYNRKKSETYLTTNQHLQQQQTDVEEVQLPSDTEECTNYCKQTVECVSHELNEMLNESCTTVHEKCINSYNADAEKLHIKCMPRETHTDIEYVESDESAARGSK